MLLNAENKISIVKFRVIFFIITAINCMDKCMNEAGKKF